jgi:hypothetical protein
MVGSRRFGYSQVQRLGIGTATEKGEVMKKLNPGWVFAVLLVFYQAAAWAQQPPAAEVPANVAGQWTLYCKDPNGGTSAKYLDLQQEGGTIKGHFKGPNASGGVEGEITQQHLVVRTKTREPLTFRGRVDGPRVNGVVQGNTYSGNFHARAGTGSFQGQRTQ